MPIPGQRPHGRRLWALSQLASFEIGSAYFRVSQQFGSGSAQHDLTSLHDIAPVSETQRMVRILLNQQYSHFPPIVNFADGVEYLLDDDRRKTERRFVE